MSRIEDINALGDKILNEWGINNAKNLGLQVCTMAIQALIDNDRLRAERDVMLDDLEALMRTAQIPDVCSYCAHDKDIDCKGGWDCCGVEYKGVEPREERENEQ